MQTFSDLIAFSQDGAGKDTSTASKTFFKQRINTWDLFITSKLPSHLNEITRTFSTVANQQYYHNFAGIREIKSLVVTVNNHDYPLTPVYSSKKWASMNAITIQAGAIPTHYYKRQRDYGIYPIPQSAYTATIELAARGGAMTFEDYTTGTVAVTENDQTVTVTTGNFTTGAIKSDYWFSLADSNGEPRGNWYRIASITDASNLELESVFEESTEATANYIIGQTPEGPEEGYVLRAYGALQDYFLSFKQSPSKAKVWGNMLWTGDPATSKSVAEASSKPWLGGGLIGLINDYRDRDTSQLIDRSAGQRDARDKVWGSALSM